MKEHVHQSLYKRSLTHKGATIIACDNINPLQPHDIPPPLAPWNPTSVKHAMATHPAPHNAHPVCAARIKAPENVNDPTKLIFAPTQA